MGSSDKLLYVVGSILVALLVIVGFQNFMNIWDKHHGHHSDAGYDLAGAMKKEAASETQTAASTNAGASEAPAATAAGGNGMEAMVATADAAKGGKLFKRCAACHSANKGGPAKIGPNLHNIVGRDIASDAGFAGYSDALKAKDGVWTVDALSEFIASPKKAVPGTRMIFAGIKKDAKRADLLAYIKTLTD